MPNCKGCGKPIVWGKTESGKLIPLDPKPPVYRFNQEGFLERVDASVTHFATCTAADQFSESTRKDDARAVRVSPGGP